MRTRTLSENWDWTFGAGSQNIKTDQEALRQRLQTRLKSWYGDCFSDLEDGVDWINLLDRGRLEALEQDIARVILSTDGVLRIDSLSATLEQGSRTATITVALTTIYGETDLTISAP